MNQSLRSRLLSGIAATTILVLLTANGGVYLLLRRQICAEFDATLASRLTNLAAQTEQDGNSIVVRFHERSQPEFSRAHRPEYFQLWRDDGSILSRSRRLGTTDLPQLQGSRQAPEFRSVTLKDGRPGRAAGIRFLPHVTGEVISERPADLVLRDLLEDADEVDFSHRSQITLVIARDTQDLDHTLSRLAWVLALSGVLATMLICGILSWQVSKLMQPLNSLSQQIHGINASQLDRRFQLPQAPAELQPVVRQLNDLLSRLDAAFLREKTLTSDIAHELRTPLAGIRTTLEVASSKTRSSEHYRNSIRRCLAICGETEAVVATLLALARGHSENAEQSAEFVDLNHLLRTVWQDITDVSGRTDLVLNWSCEPDLFLRTDPKKFRVVISNLFNNTAGYADLEGDVEIRSSLNETCLCIEIANSGCTIPADQAPHVFDRFWRGDQARSATGVHAGLGLAISQQIVQFLGGEISAEIQKDRFLARLTFPCDHVERFHQSDSGAA
ncbi:MAG: sensor histidine kinase N-terminal domain-containing protein [Planctomycetaceae bacterium]|nr:sensor histidine kinase N-terminal domain-containing protein [Planctomycetaceae bacterium]